MNQGGEGPGRPGGEGSEAAQCSCAEDRDDGRGRSCALLRQVGVAIDRDARHVCLRFFSCYFSCFSAKDNKIKKKKEKEKIRCREKEGKKMEKREKEIKEGRKEERKERKNAPTETGPLPRSHAQDLFVNRVRGTPSLRFINIAGQKDSCQTRGFVHDVPASGVTTTPMATAEGQDRNVHAVRQPKAVRTVR